MKNFQPGCKVINRAGCLGQRCVPSNPARQPLIQGTGLRKLYPRTGKNLEDPLSRSSSLTVTAIPWYVAPAAYFKGALTIPTLPHEEGDLYGTHGVSRSTVIFMSRLTPHSTQV